jgi:hypothetical protein
VKTQAVELATQNNAMWCDTVCRAHGIPGEFRPHIWVNPGPVPRYYPNAVTLTTETTDQMDAVQTLITRTDRAVSIKDSFGKFDLTPLGFQVLFEASWVWYDTETRPQTTPVDECQWAIVQQPDQLARWETAWNGGVEGTPEERIFRPALLADPELRILGGIRDGQFVAGAIANRTGPVVGLSNQFGDSPDSWAGCLTTITTIFPECPIVGYERGTALAIARTLGFVEIGKLRVWLREIA